MNEKPIFKCSITTVGENGERLQTYLPELELKSHEPEQQVKYKRILYSKFFTIRKHNIGFGIAFKHKNCLLYLLFCYNSSHWQVTFKPFSFERF